MENLNPAEYANQQLVCLQYYPIKRIIVILTVTDKSKEDEANTIMASLIDWKDVFLIRQCLKLRV